MKIPKIYKFKIFRVFFISLIIALVIVFMFHVGVDTVGVSTIGIGSRLLNGIFGALLVTMSLTITLTSNLYSPSLVNVFLKNYYTLSFMIILVLGQLNLFILSNSIEASSVYFILHTSFIVIFYATIVCIIPYLYFISHFLMPTFFIPILKEIVKNDLIHYSKNKKQSDVGLDSAFQQIDVLINIANTAQRRNDEALVKLITTELFDLCFSIEALKDEYKTNWNRSKGKYINNISNEGKQYLYQSKLWPEAYILGILKDLLCSKDTSHSNLSYFCYNLLEFTSHCLDKDKHLLVEINVMILNSIFKNCIKSKQTAKITIISFHYRILTNLIFNSKNNFELAINSLINILEEYSLQKECEEFSNIINDQTHLIIFLASEVDEQIFFLHLSPLFGVWLKLKSNNLFFDSIVIAVVKAYWELDSRDNRNVGDSLIKLFGITEDILEANTLKLIENNRVLSSEFDIKFVSQNLLSRKARRSAEGRMEVK